MLNLHRPNPDGPEDRLWPSVLRRMPFEMGERSEVDTVKCPMCRQGIYSMYPRLSEEEIESKDPEKIEQRTSVLVRAGTYLFCQYEAPEENSWM